MAIQLDVQLADDLDDTLEEPPSNKQLTLWAQAAWQGEQTDEPIVGLRIISAAESQQLNHDYRNKNKPTNVLSFSMDMDMDESLLQIAELQADFSMLGDLAICAEVVEQEAQQQQKQRLAHWAHMVVHGMLHLQGFDHIDEAEAQQMEQLEISIMQQLGFADPYQADRSNMSEPSPANSTVANSTVTNSTLASTTATESTTVLPIDESSMTESRHE